MGYDLTKTKILIVSSGKGGTGKSTVSAGIAIQLSKHYRVGLLDVDITTPNVPIMFGFDEKVVVEVGDRMNPIVISPSLSLMSVGFDLPRKQYVNWSGAQMQGIIEELIYGVNWGALDYIVLDMPPTTSDELIAVCANLHEKFAKRFASVVVLLPSKPSVIDGERLMLYYKEKDIPVIGVIENMSGLLGKADIEAFAKKENTELLGKIPFLDVIVNGTEDGNLYDVFFQNSECKACFEPIGKDVEKFFKTRRMTKAKRGW